MPPKPKKNSTSKSIIFALVLIAAGVGGVYLGDIIKREPQPEHEISPEVFTELTLLPDSLFPNLTVQTEEFDSVTTYELIPSDGAIALFIDPGCPPCHSLSEYWQRAIDNGQVRRDQVIGFAFTAGLNFQTMRDELGITFPIYSDPNYQFMRDCGIDGFPLMLIIDGTDTVRYSESNANNVVTPEEAIALMQK